MSGDSYQTEYFVDLLGNLSILTDSLWTDNFQRNPPTVRTVDKIYVLMNLFHPKSGKEASESKELL